MSHSLKALAWSIGCGIGLFVVLIMALTYNHHTGRAAGGVLCVVPPDGPPGPFPVCNQLFSTVQAAVDTAVGGEEIWVATGIYTGVHTENGVTQLVYVDKNVTIRGGYIPPFDAPPDPLANPTILDAQQQGRVIYVVTNTVVNLTNLDITGGKATGLGGQRSSIVFGQGAFNVQAPSTMGGNSVGWGGGVFGISVTVTISHSFIYSNIAETTPDIFSSVAGFGGGLAFRNSHVTLLGNTIHHNIASREGQGVGGGIGLENSTFYLDHNWVLSNTALITTSHEWVTGFGGGLAVGNSQGELHNNQIANNIATENGGHGWGGGVYVEQGSYSTESVDILFSANQIERNVSLAQASLNVNDSGGEGGGLLFYSWEGVSQTPVVTMVHNLIQYNVGARRANYGLGGGLFAINRSDAFTLTFENNDVVGNVALAQGQGLSPYGLVGGFVVGRVSAYLENNRFMSNTAVISGSYGVAAALYVSEGRFTQRNDIVRNNVGNARGEGGNSIIFDLAQALLTNVVIADNGDGDDSEAVFMIGSDVTLLHPTIARNQVERAIYIEDPTLFYYGDNPGAVTVTNAILVSHTVGVEVRDGNTAVIDGILWYSTPVAVSSGPGAVITINNQILGDPNFAPDGYHITAGSVAIWRGVSAGVHLDIDGEGRPLMMPSLGVDEYWAHNSYLPFISR